MSDLSILEARIQSLEVAVSGFGLDMFSSKTVHLAPPVENERLEIIQAVGDTLPAGTIVMWWGPAADVPDGWALCDGQSGRPELIGAFPRGAQSDDSDLGSPGGYDNHGDDSAAYSGDNIHDDHDVVTRTFITWQNFGGSSVPPTPPTGYSNQELDMLAPPSSGYHHTETDNRPKFCNVHFIIKL